MTDLRTPYGNVGFAPDSVAPEDIRRAAVERRLNICRLSTMDREAIRSALQSAVSGYGRGYVGQWSDVPTLERIAYHAIGCTADDLRDPEIGWIHGEVIDLLGLA